MASEAHADIQDGAADPRDRDVRSRGHRALKALLIVAGIVVALAVGFFAGGAWGHDLVSSVFPGLVTSEDSEVVTVTEQIDDGYGGTLANRVAAVAADTAAGAAQTPSLDAMTSGALDGIASATGKDATYLTQDELTAYQALQADPSSQVHAELITESAAVPTLASDSSADAQAQNSGATEESSGDATAAVSDGSSSRSSIGFIRIDSLSSGVADVVAQAIDDLSSQGAAAFVLDLRGTDGGDISQAVQLASLFLDGGTVAVEHTASGDVRQQAQTALHATDAPLVVLVSHDTTGVAEVVAGALQDHQRALIVGDLTSGSGEVLTLRTLSFGGAVLYVTGTCDTPDGFEISGQGIAPDLVLPMDPRNRASSWEEVSSALATLQETTASLSQLSEAASTDAQAADAQTSGEQSAETQTAEAQASLSALEDQTGTSDQIDATGDAEDAGDAQDTGASQQVTLQEAAELLASQGVSFDAQLVAAVDLAWSWLDAGNLNVEGLTNAPGPQQDAFDEARESLESLGPVDWDAADER